MTVDPVMLAGGKVRKLSAAPGATDRIVYYQGRAQPLSVAGVPLGSTDPIVVDDTDPERVRRYSRTDEASAPPPPPPPPPPPSPPPPDFVLVDRAFTTITALGGAEFRIQRNTGGNTWDASAVGTTALTGDFILRFIPEQNNLHFMVGVDADPAADDGYTSIDIDLFFEASTYAVDSFSAGVTPIPFAVAYSPGDTWFLRRSGSTVTIGHGGTDGVTGITVVGTYTKAGTLYFDSCLNGAAVSVLVKRIA